MLHYARRTTGPALSLESMFRSAAGRAYTRRVHDRAHALAPGLQNHGDQPSGPSGKAAVKSPRRPPSSVEPSIVPTVAPPSVIRGFQPKRKPPRRHTTLVKQTAEALFKAWHDFDGVPVGTLSPLARNDHRRVDVGRADVPPPELSPAMLPHPQPDPPWWFETPLPVSTPSVWFGPFTSHLFWAVPRATSKDELYENLLRLLQTFSPPPTVYQLIQYHTTQSPPLRSTRSYNLLIGLAQRQAQFAWTKRLLEQMQALDVPFNAETDRLRVRQYVLMGRWREAWQCAFAAAARQVPAAQLRADTARRLPVPLWLELFGTPKRRALRRRSDGATPRNVLHDAAARHERREVLMAHEPDAGAADVSRAYARALYAVSLALVDAGRRAEARALAHDYLRGLPRVLDVRWQRACMRLVHLHAIGGKGAGAAVNRFFFSRRTVERLLACHPALAPTSTTVFLLMANLKRAGRPLLYARMLLRRYRSRWGPEVDDERVRRRLAGFMLLENRFSGARRIVVSRWQTYDRGQQWRAERELVGAAERPVVRRQEGVASKDSAPPSWRWHDEVVHPRRGQEHRKWLQLRARVRRRHIQYLQRDGQTRGLVSSDSSD